MVAQVGDCGILYLKLANGLAFDVPDAQNKLSWTPRLLPRASLAQFARKYLFACRADHGQDARFHWIGEIRPGFVDRLQIGIDRNARFICCAWR